MIPLKKTLDDLLRVARTMENIFWVYSRNKYRTGRREKLDPEYRRALNRVRDRIYLLQKYKGDIG
jgi:hypothetical protein